MEPSGARRRISGEAPGSGSGLPADTGELGFALRELNLAGLPELAAQARAALKTSPAEIDWIEATKPDLGPRSKPRWEVQATFTSGQNGSAVLDPAGDLLAVILPESMSPAIDRSLGAALIRAIAATKQGFGEAALVQEIAVNAEGRFFVTILHGTIRKRFRITREARSRSNPLGGAEMRSAGSAISSDWLSLMG